MTILYVVAGITAVLFINYAIGIFNQPVVKRF